MNLVAAQVVELKANETTPTRKSRRRFIGPNATPASALKWSSNKERAIALRGWRVAVGKAFAEHSRCLRVAWTLEWLFGEQGFAFPSDSFLHRETGIQTNKIQDALRLLEKRGLIIRASVIVDDKDQRRIWPSAEMIPPTVGGGDTPHRGCVLPPTVGRQISKRKAHRSQNGLSSTVLEARRAAQINEQRSVRTRDEGALAEGLAKRCPIEEAAPDESDLAFDTKELR